MSDVHRYKADITEVLLRYATGIDRRDWDLFRTIWAEDLDADYGKRVGHFHSGTEICDFMIASHARMGSTWHRLSNFVIEVSGDTATSRTYVHAVLNVDKDDRDAWMDVIGHYDDTLVRSDDGWKITRRVCGKGHSTGSRLPPRPS